ncbi:hypothetical protein CI694_18570, partial [Escherichia coli]
SSSIVMLMSVISTHYDLSRISVGHYNSLYLREIFIKPINQTNKKPIIIFCNYGFINNINLPV